MANIDSLEYRYVSSYSVWLEVHCSIYRLELPISIPNLSDIQDGVFVSACIVSNEQNLHNVPINTSQGTYNDSTHSIQFDHVLTFPVKYRDLSCQSRIVFSIWKANGQILGGSSTPFYNSDGLLKRGKQKLQVFFDKPGLGRLIDNICGDCESTAKHDYGFLIEKDYEQLILALSNGGSILQSGNMSGEWRSTVGGQTAKATSEWVDRLVLNRLERLRIAMETRRGVNGSSFTDCDYTTQEEAELAERYWLVIEFPSFRFPVVFEEPSYSSGGGTISSSGNLSTGVALPPFSLSTYFSERGPFAFVNLLKNAKIVTDTEDGLKFDLASSSSSFSAWCLYSVVDWDIAAGNPVDDKTHLLGRDVSRGEADHSLKPNREERELIDNCIRRPTDGLSQEEKDRLWKFRYTLSDNRRALTKLLLCVQWENELEVKEVPDLLRRWKENAPIDIADALKLLGREPAYQNNIVRSYAVDVLRNASDEDLLTYLLQLVQALRYEEMLRGVMVAVNMQGDDDDDDDVEVVNEAAVTPTTVLSSSDVVVIAAKNDDDGSKGDAISAVVIDDTTTTTVKVASDPPSSSSGLKLSFLGKLVRFMNKRNQLLASSSSSSSGATTTAEVEDSIIFSLSQLLAFLCERSRRSIAIANYFHWYLWVEADDNTDDAIYFSLIHQCFLEYLSRSLDGTVIATKLKTMNKYFNAVTSAQRASREEKGRKDQKEDKMRLLIVERKLSQVKGCFDDVELDSSVLPLNPEISFTHLDPSSIFMFKSALYPAVVEFYTSSGASGSSDADGVGTNRPSSATFAITTTTAAGITSSSSSPDDTTVAANDDKDDITATAEGAISKLDEFDDNDVNSDNDDDDDEEEKKKRNKKKKSDKLRKLLGDADSVSIQRKLDKARGNAQKIIFKTGDDMRQDQLIMQMFVLMDSILKRVGVDLKLRPYGILATGKKNGLMEFVPRSHAVSAVLAKYNKSISNFLRSFNPDPNGPGGIRAVALENFTRSTAGYCVFTYLLGVGDRHLDNIMLLEEGNLFHIDFGWIFGRDPKVLPPPFRFTQEMADAMGGADGEYYAKFKSDCCQAYLWLRRSSDLILNLLSLMVDANIADLSVNQDPQKVLLMTKEKFRIDQTDEQAEQHFLTLINDSLTAFAPVVLEKFHQIAVARR